MPASAVPLLDAAFIRQLDRLDLLSRKIASGKLGAVPFTRRSSRGAALLPVDYRDYSPGDEERFIDWNVCARLDRLVVKVFAEEQDFFVHILLDVSASCDYGNPHKGVYLRRLAAALAYIGLANSRHVSLAAFSAELVEGSGSLRGRSSIAGTIRFLSDLPSGGRTDFSRACRQFAQTARHRGLCIVLSDFLFRGGLEEGLDCLRSAGHELLCVQVLSPGELSPRIGQAGDRLELIDAETGEEAAIAAAPGVLEHYRANLQAKRDWARAAVERRGGRFAFVSTDLPVEQFVLEELKNQQILR